MGVFEDVIQQSSRKPEGFGGVLERRREKRAPMLRSSQTAMTSHLWELELIPAFGLNRLAGDIEVLAARSLDKNLFFEADILLAAWPRLTNLLAPHGCWMLCLWETTGVARSLRLFMPVRLAKVGFPRETVLQALSNEFTPIGTPLVDHECADEACQTLFQLLGDPNLGLPRTLDLTHQKTNCETFSTLRGAAQSLGLKHMLVGEHSRAALVAKPDERADGKKLLGSKRSRELRRQLRKLEGDSTVSFVSARAEDDVLDAFERFLTLELRGWKGRRGTALYNHKKIAAFSRQIVATLCSRGRCEIFSLLCDNKTIASLIMLGDEGRLMPWKMAFNEEFAACSPGSQIMYHASEKLLSRKSFIEADSLAVPDHWMMNHMWPDRIEIADLMVSLDADTDSALTEAATAKKRLLQLRTRAKRIAQKIGLR